MKTVYLLAIKTKKSVNMYAFKDKHSRAMFLDHIARTKRGFTYAMATQKIKG